MIKHILLPQLIFLLFKTWSLFVRNVFICKGQKSNLNWLKQREASVLRVLGYFTGTRVSSRAMSETLLASGVIAPSLGDSISQICPSVYIHSILLCRYRVTSGSVVQVISSRSENSATKRKTHCSVPKFPEKDSDWLTLHQSSGVTIPIKQ